MVENSVTHNELYCMRKKSIHHFLLCFHLPFANDIFLNTALLCRGTWFFIVLFCLDICLFGNERLLPKKDFFLVEISLSIAICILN